MGEAAPILSTSSIYSQASRHGSISPLDWSRPMDVHKMSDHPGASLVVNQLMAEVAALLGRGKLHKRYRQHVAAVALDLFSAWSDDPALYVAYPRGRDYYGVGERMALLHFDRDILTTVVDSMTTLGYTENNGGYYNHVTSRGKQARMRAMDRLAALMLSAKVAAGDIVRQHDELYLRAEKDAKGKKVAMPVQETRKTATMRRNVRIINDLLRKTSVRLDLDDAGMAELVGVLGHCPDFRCDTVYRVFNNGVMNRGGRFYGHWAQGIPCRYRAHLLINGEPATEYDFSGLHCRLLYAQAGAIPPAGDMYSLPNLSMDDNKAVRDVLKTLWLAAINAETDDAAIRATQRGVRQEFGVTVSQGELQVWLAGLRERHAPIAKYLGSGAGLGLQYLDSLLAEGILLDLAAQDIPAIPVHDSFIVPLSKGPELVAAMNRAWTARYGIAIGIDAKYPVPLS